MSASAGILNSACARFQPVAPRHGEEGSSNEEPVSSAAPLVARWKARRSNSNWRLRSKRMPETAKRWLPSVESFHPRNLWCQSCWLIFLGVALYALALARVSGLLLPHTDSKSCSGPPLAQRSSRKPSRFRWLLSIVVEALLHLKKLPLGSLAPALAQASASCCGRTIDTPHNQAPHTCRQHAKSA